MRRALRRAGWALAAGIGMTAPAAAQSPLGQMIEPGGHVVPAGETVVLTEGQARLEEGQVELAFLADPMLFAYGLGAHVQGNVLEVRGYVPSEAFREQALRVATGHSALHVIDRMKLHPTLAGHGAVDKPENVSRAARELLEESFPDYGKGMDVKCDARGHVTVSGSVGSYEDKVLVSRKLRQVRGCSCVVNQLGLAGALHTAHPVLTTHDAGIVATPPATAKPAATNWAPPAAPVPSRLVASPARKTNDAPSLGMPRVHADTAPLPPAPDFRSLPDSAPTPKRVVAPLPEIAPAPQRGTVAQPVIEVPTLPGATPAHQPVPPPLPLVGPEKAPAPKPATATLPMIETSPLPGASESRRPALPPVTLPLSPPPKQGTTAPAVIDVPPLPGASETRRPALPPVAPPPLPTVLPAPSKAPADKHAAGGSEESYVTEGTITFADDPPAPAKAPAKAPAPLKPVVPEKVTVPQKPAGWGAGATSSSSLKPAESTLPLAPLPLSKSPSGPVTLAAAPAKPVEGTLLLEPPSDPPGKPKSVQPAKPPAPPAPAAPARPAAPPSVRLKERIQAACGPAYEVQVTTVKGKNVLQVSITGRNETDGKRLMDQITPILKSPEFSALEINAEVVYPTK